MRIFLILLVGISLFSHAGFGSYEIWVTNQQFDNVQIIDSKTLTLMKEIPLDADGQNATSKPHMLLFSPDYKYAYVAASGADKVIIIDAARYQIAAEIHTGKMPHAAMPSLDGKRLYVANAADDTITEILTDTVRGRFELGRTISIRDGQGGMIDRPTCLMFTADSKKAYVTNAGDPDAADPIMTGSISIIDVDRGEEVHRIEPIGRSACGLRPSPNGQFVYVNVGTPVNKLLVLDTTTDKIVKEKALEQQDPRGMALSSDGEYLWIVNRQSNSAMVLEMETDEVEIIPNIGEAPYLAELTPDGQFLVATLRGVNKEAGISLINTASRELKRVALPGDPYGLAIRPVTAAPLVATKPFPWALLAGLIIALIIALGVTR